MKPSNGKRIALSAFCLLFAAVLLLVTAAVWNIIPVLNTAAFVKYLINGPILGRIVIGAVLLAAAAAMAATVFVRSGAKAKAELNTDMNLLDASDAGSAYISSAAIDSMVQRCAKGNKYVKNCASTVKQAQSGGIAVELRLTVLPECSIPAVCAALRQDIKKYVGSATGINVTDVSCAVIGIAGGAPAASEKRVN